MTTSADRLSPMAKWVRILEAFLKRDEWGVRELGRQLNVPRSGVHRTLHEMSRLGMLSESATPGRFQVGPTLVRIATLLPSRLDLTRLARPVLDETERTSHETVVLTIYDRTRRQFCAIDAAESKQAVRYMWDALREWSHLHVGSSGKGILAFLSPEEQAMILESVPDPIPGLKPVSKADLKRQLEQIRADGYVVSRSERYAGAVGVAAPIYNALGDVFGDIVITAPEQRMSVRTDAEWGGLVKEAAGQISRRLGYTPASASSI